MYNLRNDVGSNLLIGCVIAVASASVVLAGCGGDEPTDTDDEEQAEFAVEINVDDSAIDVLEDETVVVEADIENIGDITATQDIEFSVHDGDDELVTSETTEDIELDAGDVRRLHFDWNTESQPVGDYSAGVQSEDDSDSVALTISAPPTDATLVGSVADAANGEGLNGVEVRLYEEDADDIVDTATTTGGATFEISGIEPGDYQLDIGAPGLKPGFEIEEADGERVQVSLEIGQNTSDLTVDWMRNTDVVVDGGSLDFDFELDDDFVFHFPGCEQDDDGSWTAVEPDYDSDLYDVSYQPAGECFLVENVGLDIATGELDVDPSDISFPEIQVDIDDEDDEIHSVLDNLGVHIQMAFDDAGGEVDFIDGSLQLDLDTRFLLGGNVNTSEFGTSIDHHDCQLTGGWGGDITDPEPHPDDDHGADFAHDPVELKLTTGESGPNGVSGQAYEDGLFITVDNTATVDRLSEGEYGGDDPGGASCGTFTNDDGLDIDYASFINIMLNLPAKEGDLLGEFHLNTP